MNYNNITEEELQKIEKLYQQAKSTRSNPRGASSGELALANYLESLEQVDFKELRLHLSKRELMHFSLYHIVAQEQI